MGASAAADSNCGPAVPAVKYEVRVKDSGEVVAASPAGGATFPLPSPAPLRAFGTAVPAMKKGEKAKLIVRNSDCEISSRSHIAGSRGDLDVLPAVLLVSLSTSDDHATSLQPDLDAAS